MTDPQADILAIDHSTPTSQSNSYALGGDIPSCISNYYGADTFLVGFVGGNIKMYRFTPTAGSFKPSIDVVNQSATSTVLFL